MPQLTIDITDELDARLREQARTLGEEVGALAAELIHDRMEELETTASIQRGLADAAAGRTRPARAVLEKLASELGLDLASSPA